MPRTLLLSLLAVLAVLVGVAPAAALAPATAAQLTTSDDVCEPIDEWDDSCEDWDEEDPGDDGECLTQSGDEDWYGEEDPCAVEDDPCLEDAELCAEDLCEDEWVEEGSCAIEEDEEPSIEPAPHVSKLRAKAAGRRGVRVKVRFRLDRAGGVELRLERLGAGARKSARCSGRARGKARGCSRTVALRGTIALSGRSGANETTLRRWNGRRLANGRYRLTVATAAGDAQTTFKLAAPRR